MGDHPSSSSLAGSPKIGPGVTYRADLFVAAEERGSIWESKSETRLFPNPGLSAPIRAHPRPSTAIRGIKFFSSDYHIFSHCDPLRPNASEFDLQLAFSIEIQKPKFENVTISTHLHPTPSHLH